MATIDGKNTHQGLGSIAIANGSFAEILVSRKRVPRDKKEAWCKVNFNEGIQIIQYIALNVKSLSRTVLHPIEQVKQSIVLNLA